MAKITIKKRDSMVKCMARCCNQFCFRPNNSCNKSTNKWIRAANIPISRDKNNTESNIKWNRASISS